MNTLIQVSQVSKSFANHEVIKGLTFQIQEGEIVCILGESGSGKTTLIKMIGGLEDTDTGEILVDGEKITGPADNLVPGYDFINFVSQGFKLEQFRTVWDNIYSVISYLPEKEREEKIHELLELCKLQDKAKSYPRELSGGQQQRVAIAMALADDPFLLLMDEPFSNLDINMKTQIREETVEILKKAEVTVILVSHDPVDALSVADRIMILENGEISQIDTPKELYLNPRSPYAARFLGPINYLMIKGKEMAVRPENLRINSSGKQNGIVVKCVFMGMHYHVWLRSEISKEKVLIYSDQSVESGSKLHFELVSDSIS